MKLTLSPSGDQSAELHPYMTVTVESPCDDSTTADQLVGMFYMALLAHGYEPNTALKTIQEFTL
jgi:hypothetical protein